VTQSVLVYESVKVAENNITLTKIINVLLLFPGTLR